MWYLFPAHAATRRTCVSLLGLWLLTTVLAPCSAKDEEKEKGKEKKDKDKIEEITFDDLKLDLKKDEPFDPEKLTDRAKELTDQMVRIRGWILPSSVFQQKNIRNFVLVRDNMECCFGPGAAIFDCIIIEMESDKKTDFTTRPITIEGRFDLKEFKDPDGKSLAIYHLRGKNVK